jgi:transposase
MLHYGLDVHTKYTSYCALDDRGEAVDEGRVSNEREAFQRLFERQPGPKRVVMESCIAWPHVYELVADLVDEVQLAHPLLAKYIAWNKVKTDRLDARALATLLRGELVPRAYLAPRDVQQARYLVRHRLSLVRQRAACKNSVHFILFRTGHRRPSSDVFGKRGRSWLNVLPLERLDRRILEQKLAAVDTLSSLIAEADREIRDYFLPHPAFALLQTIPGVGPLIAAICIAELGAIDRFPSAKQVVSYAGLVPSEYSSGGKVRRGHITRVGSRVLRWAAIEASTGYSRRVPAVAARHRRLSEARGAGVARVATAASVLRAVYGVWRSGRPCRAGPATPVPALVS